MEIPVYTFGGLRCAECEAFLSAYMAAAERYASVADRFSKARGPVVPDAALREKLSAELTDARLNCEKYRKALHVHREIHRPER